MATTFKKHHFRNWFMLILFSISWSWAARTSAQEMRIDTEVFADGEETPLSHTVTLFDANAVFDFVDQTQQIAIFRAPAKAHEGQFILLDLKTEKRTEISTERLAGLIEKLSKWAAEQKDPLLKFSANPTFEETFDGESGKLTMQSELWTYEVATIPADDPNTLARYREFTDWSTQLNTLMNSSPPPGPRLALNSALEKNGVVPVEIRRKVDASATSLRAVHLFSWRLSREDRARLDEARRFLATFEKVGNEEFLAHQGKQEIIRGQNGD